MVSFETLSVIRGGDHIRQIADRCSFRRKGNVLVENPLVQSVVADVDANPGIRRAVGIRIGWMERDGPV